MKMQTSPQATRIDFNYLCKTFYAPNHEAALLKGIPMEMEYVVRGILKAHGIKHRIKFRGPRRTGWYTTNDKQVYYRGRATAQATCLKEDAVTFSVYEA
jgi:hypothetical protein